MLDSTTIPEGHKRCGLCGQIRPYADFCADKRHRDGLQSNCKACKNAYCRKWHADHQEEQRIYHRHYYDDHAKERREYTRQYRLEHIEARRQYDQQYRIEHIDQVNEYARQYQKAHPEVFRAISHRRKARKRALPSTFTIEDESRALDYFHGRCAVCGRPLRDLFGDIELHLDHWIPLSDPRPDNPGTVPWNMEPLCSPCNLSKNDSDPLKWLENTYGQRKARQIAARIEKFFKWIESLE